MELFLIQSEAKQKMLIKNCLWILPFFSFACGYLLLEKLVQKKSIPVPAIVGKHLLDATCILSDHNLHLKILAKKEDPDLQHGTILSQTPQPGKQIKPQQSVFVVLSEKLPKIASPHFLHKDLNSIQKTVGKLEIRNKSYFLPSSKHPQNCCIAQSPSPEILIKKRNMITYLAEKQQKPVILPDFKHKKLATIIDFLKNYNVDIAIIRADSTHEHEPLESFMNNFDNFNNNNNIISKNYIVTDQRPLAGSIVTLSDEKKLSLHFKVKQREILS